MKTITLPPTISKSKTSLKQRGSNIVPTVSLQLQSRELEDKKQVRVSRLLFSELFLSYLYSGAQTLYHCMVRGARISNNGPCLGWRASESILEYSWLNYEQVLKRACDFGSGLLVQFGLGKGSYVGIYSQNRVDYTVAEFGAYSQSMTIVPLYDTLGPDSTTWIITQTEMTLVVCDSEKKVRSLLNTASETPSLKVIVVMDDISQETRDVASTLDVFLTTFESVEHRGGQVVSPVRPPAPEELAVVCYTSGTTGKPKGAMLTHGNIVSMVSAVMNQLGEVAPSKDDVMLSFLPLAHIFERACQTAAFMIGGRIGFFRGHIPTLNEDFKVLKPTMCPCVPRLFNRMYDRIQQAVSQNLVKKALMDVAVRQKKSALTENYIPEAGIWDKSVFKPIRDNLGGRLRLLLVSSAPTSEGVLSFLRCALGCVIVEGYGQTELSGACTMTMPADQTTAGHVGPPLPCCSIKLVDVPEMEYFASEGKGEICVKGPIVFQGYLKNPAETKSVLEEDGWLHTGDIGTWLPNGSLKVIDRKKHIFKLSQGEYVAPEKIENAYILCPLVSQIFVHGESLKSCLVGIVVLDDDVVCSTFSLRNDDIRALNENQEIKEKILSELTSAGTKAGLKSFEQLKNIFISPIPFTIENNLLTPTLKSKRQDIKKFFQKEIDAMYSKLS